MAKGKKQYKYQVVKEQKQPNLHMLYLIRYKASNGGVSEKWVGQSQLRRYYQQDKLTGQFSEHVTRVLTAELVKPKPKGKKPLTPRMEGDGPVYSSLKDMDFSEQKVESPWAKPASELIAGTKVSEGSAPNLSEPKKWNVPNEVSFKPTINIKSYCYSDPNGRWHVIMCNGVEDEDTYPDQKWAQEMADMYNNPSSEEIV